MRNQLLALQDGIPAYLSRHPPPEDVHLVASVGHLSPQTLKLPTEAYDPRVHYHQVRDKWIGVRTPDGR